MPNNWRGSSDDEKYGENAKTWLNRTEHGQVGQYNVKDLDSGTHHFANPRTGVSGAAVGTWRPYREGDDKDKKD